MKKNYDNFGKVIFVFLIFIIMILIIFFILLNKKIVIYKVFNGVIFNDDIVLLVISDDDLKIFNKNKKLYIENKSKNFEIIKIDKDVLEREGIKYNQVYIKINLPNLYKVNDVVDISIMEKRVVSLKIFSIIWEGD